MTNAILGSVCLGLAIGLYALKKYGPVLTILCLITGTCAMGFFSGLLGPLLKGVGGIGAEVSVPLVLASLGTLWVGMELKHKGKNKKTPFIAMLLPALWATAGMVFLVPLHATQSVVEQGNKAVVQMGHK